NGSLAIAPLFLRFFPYLRKKLNTIFNHVLVSQEVYYKSEKFWSDFIALKKSSFSLYYLRFAQLFDKYK
ncbi:MAG: hypothetical protein LBF32_03785, partial [Streptococcaceae bacterium]|nr:hypothetical protein [Streptococcaceae bacterium]